MHIIQKTMTLLAVSGMLLSASGAVAASYKLHISLETPPTHIRNVSVEKFAEDLRKKSNGRLDIKVFHASSQYKGANVPVALAQGALDMGIVGSWYTSKLVPEAGASLLPMFYGVSPDVFHKVWDGPAGDTLNTMMEKKMRVKIIGKWLDLGYGTIFTTKKQITKPQDLTGMKMRVPGGAATVYRYKTFGANPVSIPFADVPQALQRGTVDGFMSNQEAVRSAKLWETGVKYALYDRQAFYQYVPMISLKTWNSYPQDIKDIITSTWNDSIIAMREIVAKQQLKARKINTQNGIKTTIPKASDLEAMRKKLMATQPTVVRELGISQDFINLVKSEYDKAQ